MSSSSTRRSDAVLAVHSLGYTLPNGRSLFNDLSLGFGHERTGLIGRNGVGKSTLVQLLLGTLPPTQGSVVRHGKVSYLEQRRDGADSRSGILSQRTAPLPDHRIVADVLGRTANATLHRLGLSHLKPARTIATLSGGERTRIALAGTMLEEPDLIILDEPTNDLDADSRRALYRMLNDSSCGVLVISHDRTLLGGMDRIVELTEHGATVYGGNYALYEEQRTREDAAARDDVAQAAAALKRAKASARDTIERQHRRAQRGKQSRVNSGMPKILLGMRKESSEKTSAKLARVTDRVLDDERAKLKRANARLEHVVPFAFALPSAELHKGRTVLELTDVIFAYGPSEGSRVSTTFAFPSFSVTGPERLAIAGPNGSGKSTLLQLIVGCRAPQSGVVDLRIPTSRLAYMDQSLAMLNSAATLLDFLRDALPDFNDGDARQLLARYKFRGDAVRTPMAALSGGERLRMALACTLERSLPPQLLILDEPTNHLDFESLQVVESALRGYDGAMILVSHDAEFLRRVGVQRTIALRVA